MYFSSRHVLLSLAALICVRAEVTIENKAYQNVLVSFSETIPSDVGQTLLYNMQNVFSEASQALKDAVGLKLGSITFLLPSSWDASEWENITVETASSQHSASLSDIAVDGISDSAFGKFPFALQHSGCGVPGQKVRVPKDFLLNDSQFPKGKLLAREWLKYRYGVFDENGFHGDEMYPTYERIFGRPGEFKITSCTDIEVDYIFRKEDGSNCTLNENTGLFDGECEAYPHEDGIQNVSSSLMYFHENLPNIEQVCGDYQHDSVSSNKHNVLCQGKSVWEILKLSSDISSQNEEILNEEEPQEPEVEDEVAFIYVQEENRRVVISFESTSKTKPKKALITSAVRRLVYDLPDGSEYALYSYKDGVPTEIKPLTQLKSWPSDRDVPIISDFIPPVEACFSCAIEKALEVIAPDEEDIRQTGYAVIIASSNPESKENVIEKLKKSGICLIVIVFQEDGEEASGFQEYVDASSCGSLFKIPNSENDTKSFEKIYEAMEQTLPKMIKDTITSTIITGYLQKDEDMKIPIDGSTSEVTLWLTEYFDAANIICKQAGADLTLDTPVRTQNIAAIRFVPKAAIEATCAFKFEADPILTQVRATTKPGEYFELDFWMKDTTEKESKQQMPVILYASLNFGPYPVKDAEIKAIVTTPNGEEVSVFLFDDGRGDPDITANDGIYSRYFTRFNGEGEYIVSITAKDNGLASSGKNGNDRCCGSKVNSENSKLGAFEKTLVSSFKAVSSRPTNGYKPSRITDLRIVKVDLPSIELKWTAPGGEADSGKVTKYIIKSFTSRKEAAQNFDNSQESRVFNLSMTPKEHGNIEQATINIDDEFKENTNYYIALKAENDQGRLSETSIIREIYVSEKVKTTTESDDTTTPEDDKVKRTKTNKKTVGIIIGVIVGVIVLAIIAYAAVHYFVIKPKQKKEKQMKSTSNIKMENNSTESNILNPVSSIPANVLMKHHQEVVDAKNQHKNPPIFKEQDIEAQKSSAKENQNNNLNLAESTHVELNEQDASSAQPVPPKSPKRMTFV